MSKRYRVLPYKQGSRGAKALAVGLGGKVLKLEGSAFMFKADDVVINWGNATPQATFQGPQGMLNHPDTIKHASNKKNFFNLMREKGHDGIIPTFWADKAEVPDDAYPVVCRTVLAGHSGDGIVIAKTVDELVDAPLYVKYVKKQEEYRVHVGRKLDHNDETAELVVISVQRKARRLETPDVEVNWQIRNHSNGFVYVRNNVSPPEGVLEVSRRALLASGLDFGAVDVIFNNHLNKALVLEINTAPGLEGQTVEDYVKFFKGL